MNIIGSLRRFHHRWRENRRLKRDLAEFARTFERNLAARREARAKGQIYVSGYIRRRGA